jgi:hypothetical protein
LDSNAAKLDQANQSSDKDNGDKEQNRKPEKKRPRKESQSDSNSDSDSSSSDSSDSTTTKTTNQKKELSGMLSNDSKQRLNKVLAKVAKKSIYLRDFKGGVQEIVEKAEITLEGSDQQVRTAVSNLFSVSQCFSDKHLLGQFKE